MAVRTALAIGLPSESMSNSFEACKAARRTWWLVLISLRDIVLAKILQVYLLSRDVSNETALRHLIANVKVTEICAALPGASTVLENRGSIPSHCLKLRSVRTRQLCKSLTDQE